ncbi:MAG: hemerythrin family protein [Gammaproteobacteria bacterium]|nr:hemerythrin family protein [Gammaproteobacteria bacterium]MBL6998532.1 hemerythrin family protein [Gammaproteobacteria bacterium]
MIKTSELIWQDTQHQVLLKMIDEINAKELDASVFRRLCEYAEMHFVMEEEYMQQLNYPFIDEHILAHDKFRAELKCMRLEHHSYDEIFRIALSEFLSEWLKGHIFGIDKQLEDFILKSNFK